ncbi:hypothetical protein [Methylobacterium sp. J-077]|uniref:hypothetical protein n=1 Tax=Methylobacterium sp. J-077 TaxID=2836656 RepID=UPI001FB8B336|nr:hypothetical protein [Methylobacterium sp. J-077]MCJ2122404.1 hypothetical protein [Methylobacterium sp. J-077]
MTTTVKRLDVAFNPLLIDKNIAGDAGLFSHGFENVSVTPGEFAERIRRGQGYCAQLKGARNEANFLATNVASVDIDHGLTIEDAHDSPLIQQHGLLFYTTVRHTQDHHRIRVLFELGVTITDSRVMRRINRGLARRLGGDMAATDPARLFYGHRGAQVCHVGGTIGPELMKELIADANLPLDTDLSATEIISRRSMVALRLNQELQLKDGRQMPLCDVLPKTSVHCPVHPDETASAFIIQNRDGVNGVYCSTCAKSYWPKILRSDDYDPDAFVNTARAIAGAAAAQSIPNAQPDGRAATQGPFAGCRVRIVRGQAAPAVLQPGITFVRSDKGTGKTEALKRLSKDVKTVLLVGHRRSLIRGSCGRLILHCYLDKTKQSGTANGPTTSLRPFLKADDED